MLSGTYESPLKLHARVTEKTNSTRCLPKTAKNILKPEHVQISPHTSCEGETNKNVLQISKSET